MIVRLRLQSINGATREMTVTRRAGWLPPKRYREELGYLPGYCYRDYRLDRRASAERGVIVYRQTLKDIPAPFGRPA
jgi:hypothetical protein